MKTLKVSAIIFILLIFNLFCYATTILIQKPEEVVRSSPLIIEAIVKDIIFNPVSNLSTGEAKITLSVVNCIIGYCPKEIVIRRSFVTRHLKYLQTEYIPYYYIGDRFLICLLPKENGYSTMGLYNGKFPIENGFVRGTKISTEEFISEILAIRNNPQKKFPPELPRQTDSKVTQQLNKMGEVNKISSGSFFGGEFVTWNFTWDPDYLPVTMHYNSSGAPANAPSASTIATLANSAYGLWSDTYSLLTIQNGSPFTTTQELVRDNFSVILWLDFQDTDILAYTYYDPNDPDNNEFHGINSNQGVDIRFNPIIEGSWYFGQTTPPTRNENQFDFVEILAHELGHGQGIAHCTTNTNSMMYPSYMDKTGAIRSLTDGDKAARVYQHPNSTIFIFFKLLTQADLVKNDLTWRKNERNNNLNNWSVCNKLWKI